MLSSESIGVTLLRASATGMSTPFLYTTLKGRYGKDLTMSLYPWTNVNHILLVDTHKWLLVSFQCEFLSIQEVVELLHSPNGSKCLPFQILVILLSFSQGPGSISNYLFLLDYTCTKPFFGSIHLEGCFCIDIKVQKSPHVGNFHL